MLAGVNDSPAHARQLAALLRALPAKVNLIPFNPFAGADYRRSDETAIERFRSILHGRGLRTVTRKTRGEDISAACGQLAGRVHDRSHRQRHFVRLYARARPEATA
jgi:23S rRNA (adenine2503-C2)-methyltransferase